MLVNSHNARQHPTPYLGLLGVLGFICAGAAAWILVAIANAFPDKSMIAGLDDSVSNWLTAHGTERADSIFWAISLLGGPLLIVIVLIAAGFLAMRRDWPRFGFVAIACGGGALLNAVLWTTFRLARPVDATQFTSAAQAWSFPSGHAMNALISYGILTWLAISSGRLNHVKSAALIALAAVLIGVIGFTRIYLGVHFLSDIVTGYAAGGVWLLVCIMGYRLATNARAVSVNAVA